MEMAGERDGKMKISCLLKNHSKSCKMFFSEWQGLQNGDGLSESQTLYAGFGENYSDGDGYGNLCGNGWGGGHEENNQLPFEIL